MCRLSGNSEAWEMVDREAVKGYLDQGFTVIFFCLLVICSKVSKYCLVLNWGFTMKPVLRIFSPEP